MESVRSTSTVHLGIVPSVVSLTMLLLEFFDRARKAKDIAELNIAAGVIHEELEAILQALAA